MIRAWTDYLRQPEIQGRVVFVEDYNLMVASEMVQGVDVDQHAAPPLGGERHQRHEGTGQRRAQPLGAGRLVGVSNGYLYESAVPNDRPATDYTPRIIPAHPVAAVPLKAPFITWYR